MSHYQNFERAFDNLQGIGRSWAAYSVDVGLVALQTSAERLKATAAYLEDLSTRMEAMKSNINPPASAQAAEEQ